MLIIFGIPIWINRVKIKDKLVNWKLNGLQKFLILGYGTVMFEEMLAALSFHLSEGFSLPLYLLRIGEFWALNLLVFTGFYFAWYFLLQRYRYSYAEAFFIAGTWGLFSENVIFSVIANPLYVFFIAPLVIFIYGLMITMPILSKDLDLDLNEKKELPLLLKSLLTFVVILLFSLIPILILQILRNAYPLLFPPSKFIP